MKLQINHRKFALKNHLPMTLFKYDYDAFHIIRKGITGGLSNIQHRVNISGITKINKLYYDLDTNTIYDKDTDNIMTHFLGVDFNSLNPSAFSSNQHEFIPYTNGRMYMPRSISNHINVMQRM